MNPKEKELLTQKIRETESPMPGEQ
jgi:hypothetical protein